MSTVHLDITRSLLDQQRLDAAKNASGVAVVRETLLSGVTAVIPARNEERSIGEIIERTRPVCDEVLVVDGHSTDRTVSGEA